MLKSIIVLCVLIVLSSCQRSDIVCVGQAYKVAPLESPTVFRDKDGSLPSIGTVVEFISIYLYTNSNIIIIGY